MENGTAPAAFAEVVLEWFDRHGRRTLPWQRQPSPYPVWVSEIMLQQTRVATVIPYFERFMQRFPDIESLADASIDELLHHWSGLGYYARARNLHRAARRICEQHAGRFPLRFEQVLALPGIGRSTAGAILSLGAGQRHAILDGNVKRVLARCFAVAGWPGRSAVQKRLWQHAEQCLPEERTADYNQAMMDLGALCCTRKEPQCRRCPLAMMCRARAQGDPARYPAPRPRRSVPVRRVCMLVLRNGTGEVLLERRPPRGIWGGLWSFPECPSQAHAAQWCIDQLGVAGRLISCWPVRRHTFSHFHLEITPLEIQIESGEAVMEAACRLWYNPAQPGACGLAAPVARLIREMQTKS